MSVAVGIGASPVLVLTSPCDVLVKTVAVRSFGAPEMTVGVPLMVVSTGVTVFGVPSGPTVTQRSVGDAASRRTRPAPPGNAAASPESSAIAVKKLVDACILVYVKDGLEM